MDEEDEGVETNYTALVMAALAPVGKTVKQANAFLELEEEKEDE